MTEYKHAGGRPTKYNQELANEICDTIACNSKGIGPLCEERPHWPNPDTIFTWRKIYPEFSDKYDICKKYQIEVLVDEILTIADDTSNDTIIRTNRDGSESEVCNTEWIARSKIRIDTRKWLAAKLMPKLYGDKPNDDAKNNNVDEIEKDRELLHKCKTE